MNQYVKQYQKTTVETASNEKILIMLYDGAIQFLNKAKIALNEKNWEQSHNNLMGAQRILEEFINTIDKEPNPELAQNLINLYEYFITRLIQANMKHQIEPIDEVLKFLKDLKATWEKAIAISQKEKAELITKSKALTSQDEDEDEDEDGYESEDDEDDEDDE